MYFRFIRVLLALCSLGVTVFGVRGIFAGRYTDRFGGYVSPGPFSGVGALLFTLLAFAGFLLCLWPPFWKNMK
jgi:hypothetical protein